MMKLDIPQQPEENYGIAATKFDSQQRKVGKSEDSFGGGSRQKNGSDNDNNDQTQIRYRGRYGSNLVASSAKKINTNDV